MNTNSKRSVVLHVTYRPSIERFDCSAERHHEDTMSIVLQHQQPSYKTLTWRPRLTGELASAEYSAGPRHFSSYAWHYWLGDIQT